MLKRAPTFKVTSTRKTSQFDLAKYTSTSRNKRSVPKNPKSEKQDCNYYIRGNKAKENNVAIITSCSSKDLSNDIYFSTVQGRDSRYKKPILTTNISK